MNKNEDKERELRPKDPIDTSILNRYQIEPHNYSGCNSGCGAVLILLATLIIISFIASL